MADANSSLKVLIVDDDAICLKALASLLTKHYNAQVETANTPQEALQRIYSMDLEWSPKWYDLILMDINMPAINGDVLTKIIREVQKGMEKIPIIAVSGAVSESDRTKLIEYGITDLVLKPATKEKIDAIMAKYF